MPDKLLVLSYPTPSTRGHWPNGENSRPPLNTDTKHHLSGKGRGERAHPSPSFLRLKSLFFTLHLLNLRTDKCILYQNLNRSMYYRNGWLGSYSTWCSPTLCCFHCHISQPFLILYPGLFRWAQSGPLHPKFFPPSRAAVGKVWQDACKCA